MKAASIAKEDLFLQQHFREIDASLLEVRNLDVLWQLILDRAAHLVGAEHGWSGLLETKKDLVRVKAVYPASRSIDSARTLSKSMMDAIRDTQLSQGMMSIPDQSGCELKCEGLQPILCAPVVLHNTIIGVLVLETITKSYFTPEDQSLVGCMAHKMALAVELSHLRLQSRELHALQHASSLIASTLDVDAVIKGILLEMYDVFKFEFSTISLVDRDENTISTRHGIWKGQIDQFPDWVVMAHYSLDDSDIQADIVRTGKTDVIDAWDNRFNKAIWDRFRHEELVRVFMPIKIRDRVIGTVEAGYSKSSKAYIDDEELQTLAAFINQAALALENAAQIVEIRVIQQRAAAAQRDALMQSISARFAHDMNNAAGTIPALAREVKRLLRQTPLKIPRVYVALDLIEEHATDLMQGAAKLREVVVDNHGSQLRTDVNHVSGDALRKADLSPNIRINLELASPSPLAQIDSDVLLDILVNILRNADVAMESDGELLVTSQRENASAEVCLVIQDTGPGIPLEVRERLFQEAVTTKIGQGMGYGLYSARMQLEQIGGHIEVTDSERGGARFEIRMPDFESASWKDKENLQ